MKHGRPKERSWTGQQALHAPVLAAPASLLRLMVTLFPHCPAFPQIERVNMKRKLKVVAVVVVMFIVFGSGRAQETNPGQRLTPTEINAVTPTGAGAGTSGVSGIQTRVLKGDPNRPGLYTIQLTVPANTRIEAHTHPDDRVATVISGTWHIGYGAHFDEKNLKALTAGSFYTEPPNVAHFARTANQPVVVQITGYGPTGTKYVAQ